MLDNINDWLPLKDEIWEHSQSGNRYIIRGTSYNVLTGRIDMRYSPCYDCDVEEFNRQLRDHEKAFLSYNDQGNPRFVRVQKV